MGDGKAKCFHNPDDKDTCARKIAKDVKATYKSLNTTQMFEANMCNAMLPFVCSMQ